jgi:O-acetyl-ADP-ribose deacetylase (regulator of RNase III)
MMSFYLFTSYISSWCWVSWNNNAFRVLQKTKKAPEMASVEDSAKKSAPRFCYEELKGDLFNCPSSDSLAHCVSADMRMGKGIAVLFKEQFGGVPELIAQRQCPGGVAKLQKADRFIFYLVTKAKFYHKPKYATLTESLIKMRDLCLDLGVNSVSMPKIGCGLDELNWNVVRSIIHRVFSQTDIRVNIYYVHD